MEKSSHLLTLEYWEVGPFLILLLLLLQFLSHQNSFIAYIPERKINFF